MRLILGIAAVGAGAAAIYWFSPDQKMPAEFTETPRSRVELQAAEVTGNDVAPTAALQAGVAGAVRTTGSPPQNQLTDDVGSLSVEFQDSAFFEDQYDNQDEIVIIGEYIDPSSDVLTVEPVVAIGEFLDPESPQS